MKRDLLLIGLLLFSAIVLTGAALRPPTVTAGLYCSQLRACSGDAGCSQGGSTDGCTITCGDGSTVICPFAWEN